jgi:hypothetical protein
MGTLWEIDGHLIGNDGGTALLECDECPCGERACPRCDAGTTPIAVDVTWAAGTNVFGDGAGCDGDCDDWASTWELAKLSAAEIAVLYAAYPDTFNFIFPEQPPPAVGCYFGLTAGLPCGAAAVIGEILLGGASGIAQFNVTVVWDNSTWVRLEYELTTPGTDDDCTGNFDSAVMPIVNVTIATGGVAPCDFIGCYDTGLTTIVAIGHLMQDDAAQKDAFQ